ncbi:MAG: endo-1,4-beta-xylanase [Clostridia bacterium]|nr:endo-1,4-beta-xylanase [Clostridia bacterium]
MSDRKKVLELFYENKDVLSEKINSGIEKNRKGDIKIKISDKDGNALNGAKVTLKQKSHEFRFGANLFLLDELETEEKNELYKKYFKETFNMATLPFYWNTLEPEKGKPRYAKNSVKWYRRPSIDLCMEFCEENGIEPREHALAYESTFPDWLKDKDVHEIKKELERRYKEISERYKDKIRTIEVTNEMNWSFGKTAFYNQPDYVEWCFKTAEKYFPNNQLVINESTEETWLDNCRATDKYYSYAEATILKGARVDAVGMQFHMFYPKELEYEKTRRLYSPTSLYAHMDMYSALSKCLQITEVTIPAYSNDAEDENIQAELLTLLYSILFSHPSVEQIVYWNLVDGYAYVPDPTPEAISRSMGNMTVGENYYYGGLVRFDMTPKPAYYAIKKLIHETWHTELSALTNDGGCVETRGFYGDYELTVTYGEKSVSKLITVSSKGDNRYSIII